MIWKKFVAHSICAFVFLSNATNHILLHNYLIMLILQYQRRKMVNVHHMYNKGTTPLSHEVDPTHCGVHPM
jgi:hypothetical protein